MSVYRKAQRGSVGDRSARRTNDLSEVAVAYKRTQRGIVPSRGFTSADTVLVLNESGATQATGAVMHITGCAITPSDDAEVVYDSPVLTVDVPSGDNIGTGVVVVLLEPLADGQVGAAAIDGACFAQVSVSDADHDYAVEIASDATKFESASSGNVRILYKPAGTGVKWCVVRLSGSGGSGSWKWAKITAVGTSTFSAKLLDSAGKVYGDTLTVSIAACTSNGVTITPTIADDMPWITTNTIVAIEQRSGYRAGWWLLGHNVTTCAGS